jgi:hypothetical protein
MSTSKKNLMFFGLGGRGRGRVHLKQLPKVTNNLSCLSNLQKSFETAKINIPFSSTGTLLKTIYEFKMIVYCACQYCIRK